MDPACTQSVSSQKQPLVAFEEVKDRRLLGSQLTLVVTWVLVTGVAIYLKPSPAGHGTHTSLGLPACPSVQLFDRPCPGCGLTTSFTYMAHLDVVHAFQVHALGPLFYLAFTGASALALYGLLKSKRVIVTDTLNVATIVLGALFLVYGVLRFAMLEYHSPFYMGAADRVIRSLDAKTSHGKDSGHPAGVPKTD